METITEKRQRAARARWAETSAEERRAHTARAGRARWAGATLEERRAGTARSVSAAHAAIRRKVDPEGRLTDEELRHGVSAYYAEIGRKGAPKPRSGAA